MPRERRESTFESVESEKEKKIMAKMKLSLI